MCIFEVVNQSPSRIVVPFSMNNIVKHQSNTTFTVNKTPIESQVPVGIVELYHRDLFSTK